MSIESYDLVMLGLLATTGLLGYFKGIVWQIAWIAGICLSSYVALRFSGQLAPLTGQPAPWDRLLAMLGLYIGTSLAVWIGFRVVSTAIDAVHLGAFDHQLGLVFGLAKGALICVVVTFFAVTMVPDYRSQITVSKSGQIVARVIGEADRYLPPISTKRSTRSSSSSKSSSTPAARRRPELQRAWPEPPAVRTSRWPPRGRRCSMASPQPPPGPA